MATSLLDSERQAIKDVISFNPASITITRPTLQTNPRGAEYNDYTTATSVPIANSVRIALNSKPGEFVNRTSGLYSTARVNFIVTDYESEILKYDRFTYQGRTFEIQDVEKMYVDGGLRNYQAELRDVDEGKA